ncbi:MAG TPA: BTAD domain-containing putative transcriptional regulator [Gemmatimonadaceae bacterium]|nr:BTAD domain-containing putative transcriptional regulator [Gemmatimonadaceae bacterium]
MVHLRTLGSIDIRGTRGESLDPVLAQPKRLALLVYLVLARPRGFHRRDVLLGMFWPESDATRAREALNQALRFLRRGLGTDALRSRGANDVAVEPSCCWCDAIAFEERIAAGEDAEALALYGGDLLGGFFLSDAPLFERWLDSERARLREMSCAASGRLTARCESTADVTGALHWSSRALDLSPYDEAALRRRLGLLDRSGNRVGAVREYEAFATRMRDDLDVEPSPETRAVIEQIRARPSPNGPPPSERGTPLVRTPSDPAPAPSSRRRSVRVARIALAVMFLLLAGGAASIVARQGNDLEARRIVVMPLENRTGDPALEMVGQIAADWIVQGLSRTEVVDVVPAVHVSQLLREFKAGADSSNALRRSQMLADVLNAATVVVGSYHQRDENLEFQAEVIDVRRDRILRGIDGIRGPRSDPMTAIDELRRRTVGAVAFHFDARLEPVIPDAVRPPSYEAYQAFAAGMDQRGQRGPREALEYFHKAFALDSSFTTAIFLAAIQHLNLGEQAKADSLTRTLARSRERLPALERQLLEWIEAEVRGDLPAALEAARSLVRFSDVYRGQLAHNALRANRPREAIEANRDFNIESQPTRFKLIYSRRITDAYHRLGSHRQELAEATRSRIRHPELAEPVVWEMRALIGMGRTRQARERMTEALSLRPSPDWPGGEILVRASDELRAHGHANAGREILLMALAWYRALPDSQATLQRHLRYRAAALLRADSLDAAEAAFRALATDFPDDPYYIASVGVARARRGDRQSAAQIAGTMLNRNPPYDFGHHVYERARIAAQLGGVTEALELLREAVANGFDFAFVGGARGHTAPASPDGGPHLDPAFDELRALPWFRELARGQEGAAP